MGNIIQSQCSKCHTKHEFLLGAGMMDRNINVVIQRLSIEMKSKIQLWLKEHTIKSFKTNISLTFCSTCNVYNATQIVDVLSDTGNIVNFGSQCSKCGDTPTIVHPFSKTEDNLCEFCGETLRFLEVGNWD